MTVQRVSEKFLPWIEAAIEANAGGDEVIWEFGIATVPGAETMMFLPAILLNIPSPIIGQMLTTQVILRGAAATEKEISDVIAQGMEGMRQNRSAMLAEINAGR